MWICWILAEGFFVHALFLSLGTSLRPSRGMTGGMTDGATAEGVVEEGVEVPPPLNDVTVVGLRVDGLTLSTPL